MKRRNKQGDNRLGRTKGKPCIPDDGGTEEPTDVEDMDRLVLTGLIMMMMGI